MRTTFLCVTWRASSSSRLKRRSSGLRGLGVVGIRRPDHLHRDRDLEHLVPGLIDRAHAADAEQPDDVVPGAEIVADGERTAACEPPRAACAGGRIGRGGPRPRHRRSARRDRRVGRQRRWVSRGQRPNPAAPVGASGPVTNSPAPVGRSDAIAGQGDESDAEPPGSRRRRGLAVVWTDWWWRRHDARGDDRFCGLRGPAGAAPAVYRRGSAAATGAGHCKGPPDYGPDETGRTTQRGSGAVESSGHDGLRWEDCLIGLWSIE